MVRLIDLTGAVFGRLTVKRYLGKRKWECICECGVIKAVSADNLKSKQIMSCGCLFKELLSKRNTKHGLTGSPTYKSWAQAKERCTNQNNPNYNRYGGRGIQMCERWLNSFENFLADMGEKPTKKHSLDRIDNDKGYSPDNCRWATSFEQCNNRHTSRLVAAFGEIKTMPQWLQDPRCNVHLLTTLRNRIVEYGWQPEKAITTPPRVATPPRG